MNIKKHFKLLKKSKMLWRFDRTRYPQTLWKLKWNIITIVFFTLVITIGPLLTRPALSTPSPEVLAEISQDAGALRWELFQNPKTPPVTLTTKNFRQTWKPRLAQYFSEGDEWQLAHFFAYAVISIGRVEETRAVVGFYNIWVDGMLLTAWQKEGKQWKVDEFMFLSGETFRGAPAPNLEEVTTYIVPKWLQGEGMLLRLIGTVYAETIDAFEAFAPANAPFVFPIGPVPKEKQATLKEIAYVKARMTTRLAYPQEKFAGTPAEDIINTSVKTVREVVASGNAALIRSLIVPTQGENMAPVIASLPRNLREGFGTNWWVSKGNTVSVILGNYVSPKFFIQIELDISKPESALRNMAIYDLEAARRVHQGAQQ